jgi:hypothetical protein
MEKPGENDYPAVGNTTARLGKIHIIYRGKEIVQRFGFAQIIDKHGSAIKILTYQGRGGVCTTRKSETFWIDISQWRERN